MAIAKNPKRYQADRPEVDDEAAEHFIAAAGTPVSASTATAPAPVPVVHRKTPIMVRFDPVLLKRVDAAARRRGISRSSWIQYVLSQMLDDAE